MKVYLMRHGKTDWNARFKLQGGVDIPLNEEGREMAKEAREKYKDIHFDICYTSPLSRAKETAEIVLEGRNIPIIEDSRIREMSFGIYEGFERPIETLTCPVNPLFTDPVNYKVVEGGESFDDLKARAKSFIDEMIMPHKDEDISILMSCHGAVGCELLGIFRNTPLERFWDNMTHNCELVEVM